MSREKLNEGKTLSRRYFFFVSFKIKPLKSFLWAEMVNEGEEN